MFLGPLIFHAAVLGVWTGFLCLLGIPSASRVVFRSRYRLRIYVSDCVFTICRLFVWGVVSFSILQFFMFYSPYHFLQVLWRSFHCPQSRQAVRDTYWLLDQRYQHWKMGQIEDFYVLRWGLQRSFWGAGRFWFETWGTLDCLQKLVSVPIILIFSS